MKNKVAIVVPIYSNHLRKREQVSLQQLQRVLGSYPRIFIAPESLQVNLGNLDVGFQVERFADEWFSGVIQYSLLMLQPSFYERFREYKYILIYQLDAFVFADRLQEFCDLGYDYIGAPVKKQGPWIVMNTSVGNGGFSLRCVEACRRATEIFAKMPDGHPLKDFFISCEDSFFAYCGMRKDIAFRVPSVREALEFSVQEDVWHVFRRMARGWRPFGCHGWNRYKPEIWQPIIEQAGGVHLGPPVAKLIGHGKKISKQQHRLSILRRRYTMMPVWRVYGLIRRGETWAALNMVAQWLGDYNDQDSIWDELHQEFNYLYRLSLWQSPRWHDTVSDVWESDKTVGTLLRQALLECMRRCLVSTGYHEGQTAQSMLVMSVVDKQDEQEDIRAVCQGTMQRLSAAGGKGAD